ncbi:3-hydroxyacyl-CoA dehydrogenase family protein [Brevibacterium sp.]|uniref:3-hydroxyacyl-CoA dehydrogenase family protein n=1 Tax=Brevibacterium sp. TaxID=1701 RepID=UPI0025BC3CE3|nr:3-hydroxyacyl-CoA dehydrogenase family protein [Brevibacterium sp.]
MTMTYSITRAAVVGGGYMGGGIAAEIAGAGIPCVLIDVDAATARARVEQLREETAAMRADGRLTVVRAAAVEACLTAGTDIAADVPGCDFVLEAVPESLPLKAATLAAISAAAAPSAVLASNTSTIPISELSAHVDRPERFLGCHWMNPSRIVPGVEIVPTGDTAAEAVAAAEDFHTAIGKRPTRVGDVPGFVANRLQHALFAEALRLVDEGVASPGVVDEVTRSSFGYRLAAFGPFEVADMAGLDVYRACLATEQEAYGERFASTSLLDEAVVRGHLGLKSGHGLTPLAEKDPAEVARVRNAYFHGLSALLASVEGLEDLRTAAPHTGEDHT